MTTTTGAAPVIVYTKPRCVQCNATTRELRKRGVAYEVRDMTGDNAAYERVIGLGYQQAPVVEAGPRHWSGFRPDLIQALSRS